MFRSHVTPHVGSSKDSVSEVRTSKQTWITDQRDSETRVLARRLHDIVGIQKSEPTQILHYGHAQKYLAHHDFFDPNLYGLQHENRVATFFLYLNDVAPFAGGDTYFPRAFGLPSTHNFGNCSAGLRVFPRRGAGALFYDAFPDGHLDASSLHGSCPIEAPDVEKWGGTKWFRGPTSHIKGPGAVLNG